LLLGSFTARDTLREWQDRNHPWLELTDIHRETTENIRVTVMPFYIGSRVSASVCRFLSNSFRCRSTFDRLPITNGMQM